MTTAVATNKLSGKWIGWLTSLLGGLFVAWCFYDPSTPKVNLYWFGTIMAIGMFAFDLLPNFVTAVLLLMYYILTGIAARMWLSSAGPPHPVAVHVRYAHRRAHGKDAPRQPYCPVHHQPRGTTPFACTSRSCSPDSSSARSSPTSSRSTSCSWPSPPACARASTCP
ncbi:MAG: hypothetical protein ACLSHC_04515 [Bilophila wadsworthia]